MKNVMKKAWMIAREGAAKFGGSTKMYLTEALRQAWANSRTPKVETAAEKIARAKAMSQDDFDALIDSKIKMIETGLKERITNYARGDKWIWGYINDLVQSGIALMRKERIISLDKAAFMAVDACY
ncbi:hypothetical protein [Paenibacillus sp. 1-18]|uniref:hypothetical protein n=1 Tax=Paenibacillus sp. 1-18 TaxID=1333846 RepID=UPI0004711AD2|nr:hypothetical protein [Paenibacillus sp. 1-18]